MKMKSQSKTSSNSKTETLISLSRSSMASEKLTKYERKRLENIRRNDEIIAALKLHSKASELSKRPRVVTKSCNVKSEKKPKTETPVVIRTSLRARGIQPDSKGLNEDSLNSNAETKPSFETLDAIPMKDAYRSTHSDRSFIESLVSIANKETLEQQLDNGSAEKRKIEVGSFNLESLYLDPKNIARIVPGMINHVRFFPASSVNMIVAGNKIGNIGFWKVGESEVYLYHPHQSPITGILVQPHCPSKIYTSCYDGVVRLMDAEKEIFDMGFGCLTAWDNRIGKRSSYSVAHEGGITTIDVNSENPHIVATSSSDRTARTWDLRCTGGTKLTALRTLTHKKAVQSAYFSPSGCSLATTSMDNTIGICSGVNLEDATSIYHDNQTRFDVSTFRAIWGWDESYLFIGNMKRGVDVVSAVQRETVMTLQSPLMTAIPCRFDAHTYEVGMLAGATSGGQVYIWTSR